MAEDALARIHREWREQCIRLGTYRPATEEEYQREVARWKAECNRKPKTPARRRKRPPRGFAD